MNKEKERFGDEFAVFIAGILAGMFLTAIFLSGGKSAISPSVDRLTALEISQNQTIDPDANVYWSNVYSISCIDKNNIIHELPHNPIAFGCNATKSKGWYSCSENNMPSSSCEELLNATSYNALPSQIVSIENLVYIDRKNYSIQCKDIGLKEPLEVGIRFNANFTIQIYSKGMLCVR